MHIPAAEQHHHQQHAQHQQRAHLTHPARLPGRNLTTRTFRHRTPFPSGIMARKSASSDTHAWRQIIATRLQSAGIRKRVVGDAGTKELNSGRNPLPADAPQPSGLDDPPSEPATVRPTPSGGQPSLDRSPANGVRRTAATPPAAGTTPSHSYWRTTPPAHKEGTAYTARTSALPLRECTLAASSHALPSAYSTPYPNAPPPARGSPFRIRRRPQPPLPLLWLFPASALAINTHRSPQRTITVATLPTLREARHVTDEKS